MTLDELRVTISQIRGARALLGWTQQELARRANVAASTVADLERGKRSPVANNLDAMRSALEGGGISFLPGGAVNGPPPQPQRILLFPEGQPIRLISAADLAQWAERRGSKSAFPELIFRLILATTQNRFLRLRFPADESIQLPGWDGICEQAGVENFHFLPRGSSGWELTTQRLGIREKANAEYRKRTEDPLELARDQSTFVFASLRSWPEGERWAKSKREEKAWANVSAIDGDEIVHWIELFPSVGLWLASQLGKLPPGIQPINDFWHEWRMGANLPLSQEIVLAGRDDEFINVTKWLQGEPEVRSMQADSPEETMAFLYASIDALPEPHRSFYLTRSVRALTAEKARLLGESTSPLVIVIEPSEPGLATRLAQKGHHVLVAYGSSVGVPELVTTLPRSGHEAFQDALQNIGFSPDKAQMLTRDSVRSLTVLRRLSPMDTAKEPSWAEGHSARLLVSALLAGGWDSSRDGDRVILEQLSGLDFETFETECASLTGFPDAPLRQTGSTWKIASPRDAWFRLSRLIGKPDLDRFAAVAKAALGAPDPRFELDPEERWLADFRGRLPEHSPWLLEGLTETLLLLAMFGQRLSSIPNAGQYADRVVGALLMDADAQRWYSLSRELRTLAEAAPDTFLRAVEKSLQRDDTPIKALFQEDGGPLFGSANHSNLLWALEMLAWSPHYLARAAEILAQLTSMGLKTTWANTPGSSLRTIFLLWMPQTYASLDERLQVLDYLQRKQPEVAWKLMLDTLPGGHDFVTPTPKPRWRDFSVANPQTVTYGLIANGAGELSKRLLSNVGDIALHCVDLVEAYANLAPEWRVKVVATLDEKAVSFRDDVSRMLVWASIRKLLDNHRSFPDANWSLPESELKGMEQAYEKFRPVDAINQRIWLFSDSVQLAAGQSINDWEAREKQVMELRRTAMAEILEICGPQSIRRLAHEAPRPYIVGFAYADQVIKSEEADGILEEFLGTDEPKLREFVSGLVSRMNLRFGPPWSDSLMVRAIQQNWELTRVLQVLLALPNDKHTWDLAASFGDEIRAEYWRTANIHWLPKEEDQLNYGIRQLLEARRARTAVRIVAGSQEQLQAQTLVEVLLQAAEEPQASSNDFNDPVMFQWSICQLLGRLDHSPDVPEAQVAHLEWIYLSLLEHSTRPPVVLHRAMSKEPEFFVEVLSGAFRAHSDPSSERVELPAKVKALASHAYRLLESWRTVPGANESGIDSSVLDTWVKDAHRRAVQADRSAIGDQYIGRMLSFSKPDQDGVWPPLAVREVIEEMRNEHLELGLSIALHNERGVTTRLPLDGGKQERDIARYYRRMADRLKFKWPHTSSVLEQIATSFEETARHFDENAEHTDWSY
jgi:transcriptional regulator with XRE-family HTH domain